MRRIRFVRPSVAAIFGILTLSGCVTPTPLIVDGRTIPKGTPITIRGGPIFQNEYYDAQLLLEAYGFSVLKDDQPNPAYVLDVIFRPIPDQMWNCRLTLLQDGDPVLSANGQLPQGSAGQHLDAQQASVNSHTRLFEQVLHDFQKSLDGR